MITIIINNNIKYLHKNYGCKTINKMTKKNIHVQTKTN